MADGVNWIMLKDRALRPINRRYGTYRGLIRLVLAYAESGAGTLGALAQPRFGEVRRVVFVCQGNICRSCFAEAYARKLGIAARSFGLATSTGAPAHPLAVETGHRLGVDLSEHRTTDVEDFEFAEGDLLLAMEIRQARQLLSLDTGKAVQVSLLGLWSQPSRPHIHDPHKLSAEYFETCLGFIKSAVEGLSAQLVAHQAE